jgi:hypothetical protein
MHFGTKNYLKSNRYHTAKHSLRAANHEIGIGGVNQTHNK